MTEAQAGCCQDIRKPTPSPFEIAQLDWYDGVTEGLARCKVCGTTYAFDVACTSSDGLRVYGFARIAEAHYRAVASALDRPPQPDNMQEWRRDLASAEMQVPSGRADRDLFVVARDVEAEILFARKVSFGNLRDFLEHLETAPTTPRR